MSNKERIPKENEKVIRKLRIKSPSSDSIMRRQLNLHKAIKFMAHSTLLLVKFFAPRLVYGSMKSKNSVWSINGLDLISFASFLAVFPDSYIDW